MKNEKQNGGLTHHHSQPRDHTAPCHSENPLLNISFKSDVDQRQRSRGIPGKGQGDRGLPGDRKGDRGIPGDRQGGRGKDAGQINVFIPERQMNMDEAILQGKDPDFFDNLGHKYLLYFDLNINV